MSHDKFVLLPFKLRNAARHSTEQLQSSTDIRITHEAQTCRSKGCDQPAFAGIEHMAANTTYWFCDGHIARIRKSRS